MPNFSDAFTMGSIADIAFSVDGEEILADKFILYYRSPVFKTMFDGPMAPKSENGEKPVIKIDDERISAANFRIFLKFLYTDQIEITGDNVFPLLNMAKMYDVPPLVKSCEEFLTKNLNVENAIIIANAAFLYENSAIVTKAIDYIVKSSAILKTEQKFCQMTSELLSEVLKQDRKKFAQDFLQIRRRDYCMNCQQPRESFTSSEISIFDMVLKWGKNKCKIQEMEENSENLKNILETFLPLIRFSTMTADELISVVYPTGLLDDSTFLALFLRIWNVSKNANNQVPPNQRLTMNLINGNLVMRQLLS